MSHSPPDIEKAGEHVERTVSEDTNDERINAFTPAQQKKIIRRVDYRLVSILGIMYCASLMDRTNLSAAAIAGYVKMMSQYCIRLTT